MNVVTHKAVMVELSLTEEEARWLMVTMQNAPGGHLESNEDQRFREMFFVNLNRALKEA